MNRFDTNSATFRRWIAPIVAIAMIVVCVAIFLSGRGGPERSASLAVVPVSVERVDTARTGEPAGAPAKTVAAEESRPFASGEASYYGRGFAGRPTANGETFNPASMTCAHRTLPFGTRLRVTNAANGKSVVVRVNDRGPYAGNRILDLSQGAAERIGMIASGTARVDVEILA